MGSLEVPNLRIPIGTIAMVVFRNSSSTRSSCAIRKIRLLPPFAAFCRKAGLPVPGETLDAAQWHLNSLADVAVAPDS
jgi:hypothetical protein